MRAARLIPFLLPFTVVMSPVAQAAWPEDVTPSSMLEHDGEAMLEPAVLGATYEQLVKEVGTMVSNKAVLPAETLGANGWDYGFNMQWVFNEARDRAGEPSPWEMAHTSEDSLPYQWIPSFSARKGLPLSTEVGFTGGWIGMSQTGIVGGFGRIALLEGYKPWPNLSLHAGYSGYVGNRELQVGTMDMGVTLGGTYYTGALPGVHTARISPWLDFSMLRVSSASKLDANTQIALGAQTWQGGRAAASSGANPPLTMTRFAGGWQVVSQNMHLRVGVSWAPATIPVLNTGMGLTF